MSRTYRKRSYTEDETKVQYINRGIANLNRAARTAILTPHNKKQFELDHAAYEKELRNYYKSGGQPQYKRPVEPRIYNYYIGVWVELDYDYDEEVERLSKEYDKFKRDGHWNETSLNTGFKKQTAQELRRKNRKFCRKAMVDEDYENTPMPIRKEGKARRWDWW